MNQLAAVVEAARRGDADAWAALVQRFEDFAMAVALGRGGDWDGARDVAQDAFLLAVARFDELSDPAALPGWFAALVRTASSRRPRDAAPIQSVTSAARMSKWLPPFLASVPVARRRRAMRRARLSGTGGSGGASCHRSSGCTGQNPSPRSARHRAPRRRPGGSSSPLRRTASARGYVPQMCPIHRWRSRDRHPSRRCRAAPSSCGSGSDRSAEHRAGPPSARVD